MKKRTRYLLPFSRFSFAAGVYAIAASTIVAVVFQHPAAQPLCTVGAAMVLAAAAADVLEWLCNVIPPLAAELDWERRKFEADIARARAQYDRENPPEIRQASLHLEDDLH